MTKEIRLLAYSQYLCLKHMEDDRLLSVEELNKLDNKLSFMEYDYLHKLIYEKLGFDYNVDDFFPDFKLIKNIIPIEFTYTNSIVKNKIAEKVKELYGDEAFILYTFIIMFLNLFGVCSVGAHIEKDSKETYGEERKRIGVLKRRMFKYFKELIWIFDNSKYYIKFYNAELVEKLKAIERFAKGKKITTSLLTEVLNRMTELLVPLVPESDKIFTKAEKAKQLVEELKLIEPGQKDWVRYEKFCIRVLNYLFVPPFRKVYTQVRTSDGYERRDAILPNNCESKFWTDIKREFNSKNVVFEFKNLSKGYNKDALNQLRIYLSKPTIGKFGFLFVREEDAINNLGKAQKDAYEQNGILIIIVTDSILKKLIMAKNYFGTCDDIIANEKVKFEINY